MTECCLFVCCRPSTSSRLVGIQYSAHATGFEEDLQPLKIKTLLAYCQNYPRKVPRICQILEKRIRADFKRNRKGFVMLGFLIFRDICMKLRNHDAVDIVELHFRNCVSLVLSGTRSEYIHLAYSVFIDYTEYCSNADVRDFVVPIENMCLKAKSSADSSIHVACLKFMLRLINSIIHQAGNLEQHIDTIVPIIYHYYSNVTDAGHGAAGAIAAEVFEVDQEGALRPVRTAAESCLSALATSPSASTLIRTLTALFAVFDRDYWENQDCVNSILLKLAEVARENMYQLPVAHAVITHARNIAIGTSASFRPGLAESSPIPSGAISRAQPLQDTLALLPVRTQQGSEAALRMLKAKCCLLRNVLASAVLVMREEQLAVSVDVFRPLMMHLGKDWNCLLALTNHCSLYIVDLCPHLADRILELAQGVSVGRQEAYGWMDASVYLCRTSAVGPGGATSLVEAALSRQESFDPSEDSATREQAGSVLGVIDRTIQLMKLTLLAQLEAGRIDVLKWLLQRVCTALMEMDASGSRDRPASPAYSRGMTVGRVNRVLLLYILSTLLGACVWSARNRLTTEIPNAPARAVVIAPGSSTLCVEMRSICHLCTLLTSRAPEGQFSWATLALSTLIINQVVSLEVAKSSPVFSQQLCLPNWWREQTHPKDTAMPVPQAWQLRNLLLRDAAFQVLCSNGDGSTEACHELKVAAVWSIQEHLLASYGLAEVTASLPMALALDDFCQAYPLDKMQTLDAVERSFQVIGAIQTYLWAYVETLQNILQCDVSVVCAQLRQNCSLCRERSGRRDFELQLRGGSITLSSNAIVSTAPATSSPHEKKVPVDDVAPHRPPPMDREALHIALLAAKTLQQDYDHVNSDSITEAFSEPFDPVADPAERLSQIHNISMGVNGLTVAEHRHSSATMHTTELVPDDGVTVSLKGLPAPVDSTAHAARQGLTHATTASCAASCRAGEEAGSCTTSRSCLNRDTMMHPTKRWTEKCDRLSRIYSEVLKEARRPSHSVDRGSPFVNEGSGEKRFAALLQEVDDLQLFGNVYPDLGS